MQFPARIHLRDVTLRDGLQNEPIFVSTDEKVALLEKLLDAGFKKIEVSSFVHPVQIPALQDADEFVVRLPKRLGVEYQALVPNERGFDRFQASPLQTAVFFLSASTAHNEANVRRTTEQSLQEIIQLVHSTVKMGRRAVGAIATAFVCPFSGTVPFNQVELIAERLVENGVQELSVADTIGQADPRMIYERCVQLASRYPNVEISLHLHDPLGYGLANVLAAIQAGVHCFDVAQAGLGGCPTVPGAPGNLRASRVVQFLEKQGITTGVKLDYLKQLDSDFKTAVKRED